MEITVMRWHVSNESAAGMEVDTLQDALKAAEGIARDLVEMGIRESVIISPIWSDE